MGFLFQNPLQQPFQPRGFGNVNQLARHPQQVRARPHLVAQRVKVLDVDDAERLVQVAAFAKREARVTGFFRERDAFGQRCGGVERGNFLARLHDFARGAVPQIQRVQDQVAAVGRTLYRREDDAQFLLRVRAAGLRVRLDADFFQQKTRGEIEQPVERIKREVKPVQRPRRCQRDRQRLLDRQPFRREFARRDVQERQRAEADGEGNRVLPDDGFDAERNQQRRKQRREHRLADPAEAKARHRDAKLRRAQIRIQIADNVLRRPRAALFFYDERVELRFADADERELGGDEKSVQQHQHEHGEDF